MDWFDLFFPEQSQARSLQNLAAAVRTIRLDEIRSRGLVGTTEDLEFLAVVLLSLLDALVEKGLITREEILAQLQRLGPCAGDKGGKDRVNALRGALNVPEPPKKPLRKFPRAPSRKRVQ